MLLLNPVVAALVYWRFRRNQIERLQSLVIFALFALLGLIGFLHLCSAGNPMAQWIVPGVCAAVAVPAIQSRVIRRAAAVIWFVVGAGLSFHYLALVHGEQYTGNPKSAKEPVQQTLRNSSLRYLRDGLVAQSSVADTNLAAGWLFDVLPGTADQERVRRSLKFREIKGLWHTWLTGLYRVENIPADVWYPGGPLSVGATHIEIRVR